jgi:hypothetical protein
MELLNGIEQPNASLRKNHAFVKYTLQHITIYYFSRHFQATIMECKPVPFT